MSQQVKQLEDRISRLESDLAQLRQMVERQPAPVGLTANQVRSEAYEVTLKRGPGWPKKTE